MAVTLTQKAAEHVAQFIAKRGKGVGVRLGVKTTGCSGLAYKLEFVDQPADEDLAFDSFWGSGAGGPQKPSLHRRHRARLHREGLNEGFKFNNPNVKSECGCGESFKV